MSAYLNHDPAADRNMVAARGVPAYLPKILIYPLRGHAPPTILLASLLLGIGSAGIVAVLLLFLGMFFTAHYSVRIIEQTSFGHARPPALTGEVLSLGDSFTWSSLLAPAAMCLLHFQQLDTAVCLVAVLLPAHWIALATTRSLKSALNPLRWLQIASNMAPTYLLVCALSLGGISVATWAGEQLSSLLLFGAGLYLLFAACHMLGFGAHHHHEALGIGVHVERPSEEKERDRRQRARLDWLMEQVRAEMAAQRPEKAAHALFDTPAGPANPRQFHEELYDRLKAAGYRPMALTQAARLIRFLLKALQPDRALEIVENALDQDRRFRTETCEELAQIALHALQTRRHALLERLLSCSLENFAGDPALPLVDLAIIRHAIENKSAFDEARQILHAAGDLLAHPQGTQLRAFERLLNHDKSIPRVPPA